MSRLEHLDLQNNSFSGEIPAEWFNTPNVFPQLRALDLRWNNLRGAMPKQSTRNIMARRNNLSISIFGYPIESDLRERYILRMCVLPMSPGYGLCGESPRPGPTLASVNVVYKADCAGRTYDDDYGYGDLGYSFPPDSIVTLPPCPSGKPPILPYCTID
jgi:hypothetical protein